MGTRFCVSCALNPPPIPHAIPAWQEGGKESHTTRERHAILIGANRYTDERIQDLNHSLVRTGSLLPCPSQTPWTIPMPHDTPWTIPIPHDTPWTNPCAP